MHRVHTIVINEVLLNLLLQKMPLHFVMDRHLFRMAYFFFAQNHMLKHV